MSPAEILRDLEALLHAEIDALAAGEADALEGFLARKHALAEAMRQLPPVPDGDLDGLRDGAARVRALLRRDADLIDGLNAVLSEAIGELRRAGGHPEQPRLYGPHGRSVTTREFAKSLDKSL